MEPIADFFLKHLIVSPGFNSPNPVDDQNLLFPGFLSLWQTCVEQYKETHPNHDLTFTETYRSNVLQEKYFNQGASKIRVNGMHHYGIAGDAIFIIDGEQTYKGDINLLREIYVQNDLTILGTWDLFHVQFISVGRQQALRDQVTATIKTFQAANGLDDDGKVGPLTIAKAKEVFGN